MLKSYIKKVDVMICEGTTLANIDTHHFISEIELKEQIRKVVSENKYVFVMCASTNIYRIAGICSIVPRGKYCLMDYFENKVIDYIRKKHIKDSNLYEFKKARIYSEKIDDRYKERGFVMFIRQSDSFKKILDKYHDAKIIYSMWSGYLDKKSDDRPTIREWLEGRDFDIMHTSGHADAKAIKSVVEEVKPDKVIPIHTENKRRFIELVGSDRYVDAEDGEIINI